MKRKNFLVYLICSLIAIFLLLIVVKFWIWNDIKNFFSEYMAYLQKDLEHRISLFERIVGAVFAGLTTFIALLITILHENKKNKEIWEREREKDREIWKRELEKDQEARRWNIKPTLDLTYKSMSNLRNRQNWAKDKDNVVKIGQGDLSLYIVLFISNEGNGECKNILLNNQFGFIGNLHRGEGKDIQLNLEGIHPEHHEYEFQLEFSYRDVTGTAYIQKFACHLFANQKIFKIETC